MGEDAPGFGVVGEDAPGFGAVGEDALRVWLQWVRTH